MATSLGLCTLVAEDDILVSSHCFSLPRAWHQDKIFTVTFSHAGRPGHHGLLRKPVHAVLRKGGWLKPLAQPPGQPAPHQRPAVLGSAAHHLHRQPAQGGPAQVRAGVRNLLAVEGWSEKDTQMFFPQAFAQTAKAVGKWRRQYENRCGRNHRPPVRAGQRPGLCESPVCGYYAYNFLLIIVVWLQILLSSVKCRMFSCPIR